MPKQPTPDEFGRLRVRDDDTGHERSIDAATFSRGNYTVTSGPASTVTGDPVPPKLATKPLSGSTNRGQQADSKKENDDA